jgi:hypothetical protein
LRDIQTEAAAIYRRFPELDRRPKAGRAQRLNAIAPPALRTTTWPAKLH